ncbi:ABC transporter ATP-binding protein [Arthrobacter sp. EPSL27]|uniref:ABC transporter ATP-binding protein n=1 Tax=Arthrobacter sp. EPSL27 TaxID=1745378 RepID=UPI0007467FEB|nr:ATP-binding cassette domain-containing protein [Arthrobacter sp. EPSL27]KUM37422.1 hypothetical protein AR539_09180 [Arthrobacter sp. EPSL27]
MTNNSLEVLGLSIRYGKAQAVSGVSLTLPAGMVTAITGPNGAGKSTLLLALRGTVESTGIIRIGGQDARDFSMRERAKAIAIVPQGRQLFPRMTVRENLQVMASLLRLPRGKVDEAMDRFPVLRTRSKSLAGVLSGGEQQMLAVARALMAEPAFLLLDEPMTGLAPLIVQSINETIRDLAAGGVGVVIAEPAVRALGDVVQQGHVLIRGSVAASANSLVELERAYKSAMGVEERILEEHLALADTSRLGDTRS